MFDIIYFRPDPVTGERQRRKLTIAANRDFISDTLAPLRADTGARQVTREDAELTRRNIPHVRTTDGSIVITGAIPATVQQQLDFFIPSAPLPHPALATVRARYFEELVALETQFDADPNCPNKDCQRAALMRRYRDELIPEALATHGA
jgi:hypothetical protein